jgi:hypothetical protein
VGNPVANGVPVRRLPPELLAESKENLQTIPLSLLRQPPGQDYRLAGGDVLGVWVEGVLGEKGQAPLVRVPEMGRQLPALGFPIPVHADGTISLPLVPPIKVGGMTLEQAEAAVKKAYIVDRQIINAGHESIIVTLQRPRESHILVIRQDSAAEVAQGSAGQTGARATGFLLTFGGGSRGTRRGTGYAIDLPAYENDVLNALARTGGFPGTDAVNEIIVERSTFQGEHGRRDMVNTLLASRPGKDLLSQTAPGTQRIRIPLRYRPCQPPSVQPEDVVLHTGDIVYIEAREADVYYTAGLLPSGEYVLPRDTDLDVVQAIARVGGPILISGLNTANINGQIINPGLSFPTPTLVSVLRRTPDGGQVVIRVDLDRALRDPRERILIQPKDLIILQESPQEAIARYVSEMFNFNLRYIFVNNGHALGTTTTNAP